VLVWSPSSAPVALLLTIGIVIGPLGINLLSPAVLPFVEPVVPVALAALGVLVGLGVGDRRSGDLRLFAAASLVAAVTALVVSGGFALVTLARQEPITAALWIAILTGGICAATSLTLPADDPAEPRALARRAVELGVLLPIVAGGLVLAALFTGAIDRTVVHVAEACGVTLALAAAAWLLLTRASSETEERVFAVSALLLVGGVAEALSLSALFAGLVAGVFWRCAGRHPRETIRRDVLFVQHPLVVLVLLTAGARAELSPASIALGAGYAVLRLAGLRAGTTVTARFTGVDAPGDFGRHFLRPGLFGVAFALNAVSVIGGDASLLLAAVVVGTIGGELVALLLPPRSAGE
jgi:hypothetical protein